METTSNSAEQNSIYQEKQLLLTIPKPSDFYTTNRQETALELFNHTQSYLIPKFRKYRFVKVYPKFAWCLFASETSGTLHLFRIIPNGNEPVWIPFYQCVLTNPSSCFPYLLELNDAIIPPVSPHKRKVIRSSGNATQRSRDHYNYQGKSMQIYVNNEDLTLNQSEMEFCRISKSKTNPKYIVVPAPNLQHVQQCTAHHDMEEVHLQQCFDGEYKSDVRLVELKMSLTDSQHIHETDSGDQVQHSEMRLANIFERKQHYLTRRIRVETNGKSMSKNYTLKKNRAKRHKGVHKNHRFRSNG